MQLGKTVSKSCITYILHKISDGATWCTDFLGLVRKKAQTQVKVVSDTEGRRGFGLQNAPFCWNALQ